MDRSQWPLCCHGNRFLYSFWVPAGIRLNDTPALSVPSQFCCVCVCSSLPVCCIDSGLPVVVSAQRGSILSFSLPVIQVIHVFPSLGENVCVRVCMVWLLMYIHTYDTTFLYIKAAVCACCFSAVRETDRHVPVSFDITLSEKCWDIHTRLVFITASQLCGCDKVIFYCANALWMCMSVDLLGRLNNPQFRGFLDCIRLASVFFNIYLIIAISTISGVFFFCLFSARTYDTQYIIKVD